ncbi:hypothetical protein CRG98_040862 [Punica granatum]|uniref:Uncharacterized protein n=1 Tax=Punica granatum TaxID=22663 RepID=A0A2I0I429_PUNGR|nr:hypothetical protein CRG98_040862 [Punica granatum]
MRTGKRREPHPREAVMARMISSHEAHWLEREPAKRWASKGRWWEWSRRQAWEQEKTRSEADLRTMRGLIVYNRVTRVQPGKIHLLTVFKRIGPV